MQRRQVALQKPRVLKKKEKKKKKNRHQMTDREGL